MAKGRVHECLPSYKGHSAACISLRAGARPRTPLPPRILASMGPRDVLHEVSKAVLLRRPMPARGSVPLALLVWDLAQLVGEGQQPARLTASLAPSHWVSLCLSKACVGACLARGGGVQLPSRSHHGSGRRAGGKRLTWVLACPRGSQGPGFPASRSSFLLPCLLCQHHSQDQIQVRELYINYVRSIINNKSHILYSSQWLCFPDQIPMIKDQ